MHPHRRSGRGTPPPHATPRRRWEGPSRAGEPTPAGRGGSDGRGARGPRGRRAARPAGNRGPRPPHGPRACLPWTARTLANAGRTPGGTLTGPHAPGQCAADARGTLTGRAAGSGLGRRGALPRRGAHPECGARVRRWRGPQGPAGRTPSARCSRGVRCTGSPLARTARALTAEADARGVLAGRATSSMPGPTRHAARTEGGQACALGADGTRPGGRAWGAAGGPAWWTEFTSPRVGGAPLKRWPAWGSAPPVRRAADLLLTRGRPWLGRCRREQ